jgi:hypothetical protein
VIATGVYRLCMSGLLRHRPSYHAWPRDTPVIDAIRAVVAVASIVIGTYAALFLAAAVRDRDWDVAADCGYFFAGIALANGLVDCVRHWRRHHG